MAQCSICDTVVPENTPFRYDGYVFCSGEHQEEFMQDVEKTLAEFDEEDA